MDAQRYSIGGIQYRLEPLSWQQNKWLGEHIFKNIDIQQLDYAVIHDLLREKGPLFMAICLIDAAHSRADHSRLSWSTILERADLFAAELTGGEVALFGPHFFRCCRPDQLAMLVPGRVLQDLLVEQTPLLPAPGQSGSNAASSRSVEEISHEFLSSSSSGDRPSPIPISSDVSSETPSTALSWDGSASSSPG